MGLFVNTNIAAVNAQRSLLHSTSRLNRSYQRLSSGLRINTARDDAAGLAISERFTSQIRGLNQAVRNANDAISLVQTAETALSESGNILQRIRELAVQAASDVNNDKDRTALQEEVSQLKDELQRIGEKTTFNQETLLDGSYLAKHFQIGMNFRESVQVRVRDSRAQNLGRHAVATGTAVTTDALAAGNLAIDGVAIRASQSDGVSTSFAAGSALAKANAINDSTDFHGVTAYVNATTMSGGQVPGGTLDETDLIQINGETITGFVLNPDDAGDQLVDAINGVADATGVLAARNSQGQIELTAEDGRNIEITGQGQGLARTGLAVGVNTGTVTIHSEDSFSLSGNQEAFAGFNDNHFVGVSSVQAVETMDVTTREGANLALLIADRALQQLSSNRSELGAVQNRIESTISNLSAVVEAASAARSRILDADFAAETAQLTRNQIMQQAGTTILAQANQQPQQALSLLQ